MLSFDASLFAIAGAVAAAGPIIIHLLNRRRFRTVSWAAMDFLREALERNRKILHIRDILLLALRVLAVVLFGLVLARPFFKGSAAGAMWHSVLLVFCLLIVFGSAIGWVTSPKGRGKALGFGMLGGLLVSILPLMGMLREARSAGESVASARAPVHAVVVVDNSRSLGVEALGGTLLDRAKGKGAEFIDSLPPESRITVIPLAGSEDPFTLDAYRNKEDARRVLDRLKLVDVEGSIRAGLELAEQACQQAADLPSKRVVVLTDLQANAWQAGVPTELMQRLSGLQIVNVATAPASNVWVSDFHVEDGLASAEVPCRLLARVEASGSTDNGSDTSFEVQVKLLIDGTEVASQAVELSPGQAREIEFSHLFDVLADPLKPSSVVATVVVQSELQSTDQLPTDNKQQIVIPIVASLPVVFVDQYGDEENLEKNKIGETYALRHLMAPRSSSDKSQRRLIHVEHVRPEGLTQELLETARLVVIAGIEKPDEALIPLLRDYVQQGGPLVILAGANFDPVAWQERAWLDGQGLLPAPLDPKPHGVTPEEAPQQVVPFYAAFSSMQHDFFLVEGESSQSLSSLFETTPFFKAVQTDLSKSLLESLAKSDAKRFTDEKAFLDGYASQQAARATEKSPASAHSADEDRRYREIEPVWWHWRSPLPLVDRSLSPEELAKRSQPRVLATFDIKALPFAIERRIGAGRVVMFTSGVTSNWNLMRGSGAMYLYHRAFCQLMEGTLPTRNYLAGQKITLPVERRADTRLTVLRPSGSREPLNIDALGPNVLGVTVRRPVLAGTYTISAEQTETLAPGSASNKLDDIPLAVNGAASESNLTALSVADLQQKLGHDHARVLTADEPIRVERGDAPWTRSVEAALLVRARLPAVGEACVGLAHVATEVAAVNWTSMIGRLLGYDDVSRIDAARVSFGSAWAHSSPAFLVFGCVGLVALSFWFYLRWQARGHQPTRLALAALRAVALCLLLLILSDPTLELTFVSQPKPVLWVVLDGSDSMSIPDELPEEERTSLAKAVDLSGYQAAHASKDGERPARADYARALLAKKDKNLVERLTKTFRLRSFVFGDGEGVQSLNGNQTRGDSEEKTSVSGKTLAAEWQTTGTVTALGDAFEDLARKHATDNLAGVLVLSDFDQNAGAAPLAAAKKLGVPVFTVGVGPLTAVDLSVDLLAPPTMKKAESSTISVTVRQRELENASVHVKLFAHQPGEQTSGETVRTLVGEKTVTITGSSAPVEFPYTPEATGRFLFTAEVDPVEGEVVTQNNKAEREVKIIDDFLRLMYVEYEPTWEWRFVKEVFHRDKLVGARGFRTFIRSADPIVRETNELFLPNLTLPRSQFFENDVIFLGDMPATALSTRFCEMTKEFVSQFGGGLVVMAGPRFGPGQLAETPLADMLPVVVDPDAKRRDDKEFRLTLTPVAAQFDFMRLGQTDQENLKGWNNLGKLPWYQPVRRIEAKGTQVLAEHPTDMCIDGKTPQPLIAVRQYGRGEVVYVGFNEMWRLRRIYGEEYYRQFWGQLIHRLGLSHALGSHKRFVVRTDRQQYRSDDQVLVTVEAYDKEFHPLDEKDIPDRRLTAELIRPDRDSDGSRSQLFTVPQLRPGVFETRVPVFSGGEYRLRVSDPIANEVAEINFDVANVSVERRNPVRNVSLQKNIAAETGGKAYELLDVDRFPDDFAPPRLRETSVEIFPLWSTWLTFGAVIGLLMVEWFVRKLVNLA